MLRITLRTLAARKRRVLTTGSAIVLAVAFITGSLVLRDTVSAGFVDVLADAYTGTDAVVRSRTEVGREESAGRGLLDRSLTTLIAEVDGVDAVAPLIQADARIVGADGDPVGGSGATTAGNWIDDEQLNPYSLWEGRAPVAAGEVVIDQAAAEEGDLSIGDTTYILTPGRIDVTIVGLVTFAGESSRGADTFVGFADRVAADLLLPDQRSASGIAVSARQGVAQTELVDRISSVLPDSVEAITGDELLGELADEIQGEDHEVFQQALLLFAFLALIVATFSIYNTLSILVAQRGRESALFRALGASRLQLLVSVAVEALVLATAASAVGITVGVAMASGLLASMGTLDLAVPAASPSLDLATVTIALSIGVGATMGAALVPAVRQSRIAPLAALREVAVDASGSSRRRAVVGLVIFGSGVSVTVAGALGASVELVGLGTLATLAGIVILGPAVSPRAATVLGAPLATLLGVSGSLASRNARREPRRTAATAIPLLFGVAVVVPFAVVGASLKQSITDAVDRQFTTDLVIIGEGRGGLSVGLADAVADLPEVAVASPTGGAPIRVDGVGTLATTVDPATVLSVRKLEVHQGSLRNLAPDQLAVSTDYASERGLALGDPLTIDYPDGATEQLTVGAIYADDELSEGVGIQLPRDTFLAHTPHPADVNMQIALTDGVTLDDGEAAVQQVADRFGAPDVQTNEEFTDAIGAEIDVFLTVIYALLVLTILIALLGIASSLSLSIYERTREIGLLRAVGQTRTQTRTMIRGEAIVMALVGTAGGLGIGLLIGWAIVSALADDGLSSFAIPGATIVVTVATGALGGLAAAAGPARRAARMDVLAAIAME